MSVCVRGGAGVHTSNGDGRSILGYGESTRSFKRRGLRSNITAAVSPGPDRRFSFVALAGKDGAQIKLP